MKTEQQHENEKAALRAQYEGRIREFQTRIKELEAEKATLTHSLMSLTPTPSEGDDDDDTAAKVTRAHAELTVQHEKALADMGIATQKLNAQNQMLAHATQFVGKLWRRLYPNSEFKHGGLVHVDHFMKEINQKVSDYINQSRAAGIAFDEIWIAAGGESMAWDNASQVVDFAKKALIKHGGGKSLVDEFREAFRRGVDGVTEREEAALRELWVKTGRSPDERWKDLEELATRATQVLDFAEVMVQRSSAKAGEASGALQRLAFMIDPKSVWANAGEAEKVIRSELEHAAACDKCRERRLTRDNR